MRSFFDSLPLMLQNIETHLENWAGIFTALSEVVEHLGSAFVNFAEAIHSLSDAIHTTRKVLGDSTMAIDERGVESLPDSESNYYSISNETMEVMGLNQEETYFFIQD